MKTDHPAVLDCASKPIRTVDPLTGKGTQGWIYAMHILGPKPPKKCPRCNAVLAQGSE